MIKEQKEQSEKRKRFLVSLSRDENFKKHVLDRVNIRRRAHASNVTKPNITETERAFYAGALSALNEVLAILNLKDE